MTISWWIMVVIHLIGMGAILAMYGKDKGKYGVMDIISMFIVTFLLIGMYMGW